VSANKPPSSFHSSFVGFNRHSKSSHSSSLLFSNLNSLFVDIICVTLITFCEEIVIVVITKWRLNIDIHTGMTLGEIAAKAATSGECELTIFAFSCIRVVDPSAL